MTRRARINCGGRRRAGKFGRRGLAQDDRPGPSQQRDTGGVARRPMAGIDRRPVFRRLICGVDDIFDADGQTMQWATRCLAVARPRLGQNSLGIEMNPGVDARLAGLDLGKAGFDDGFRSRLARSHQASKFDE